MAKCKTTEGTLLNVGSCVKQGTVVAIVAEVTETRHGKITTLTAHDETCKTALGKLRNR